MSCTKATRLAVAVVSVALLLAGCTVPSHFEYPQDWRGTPTATLPNGCPDLSGTYDTRPADAYPADVGSRPLLDEILGPRGLREGEFRDIRWPALPGATTATFTPSGDWLYVRFGDGAGGEATLSFKRRDWWGGAFDGSQATYHCLLEFELGPTLALDGSRTPVFAVPYDSNSADFNFWLLTKGRDGALIVNYRTESANFDKTAMFGIWLHWLGSIWWRYPAVTPNR
jgi:hypothetical protein